jgi:hypothetical protein
MDFWRPRIAVAVAAACVAGVFFVASALAAVNYLYFSGRVDPGGGGGDLTVHYRNYNDSCSGDGYGWTKSIYGLTDGSWVATIENLDNCSAGTKAHLGPSSNYGYTYVQSKCRNADSVRNYIICNTTRPS